MAMSDSKKLLQALMDFGILERGSAFYDVDKTADIERVTEDTKYIAVQSFDQTRLARSFGVDSDDTVEWPKGGYIFFDDNGNFEAISELHPDEYYELKAMDEESDKKHNERQAAKADSYSIERGKNGKDYVISQMYIDGERKDVRFAKKYGFHELDDAEIRSLLSGDEITIPVRSGDAKVKLGEGMYMGHKYFGVQKTDFFKKNRRDFNISGIQGDVLSKDKQPGE